MWFTDSGEYLETCAVLAYQIHCENKLCVNNEE